MKEDHRHSRHSSSSAGASTQRVTDASASASADRSCSACSSTSDSTPRRLEGASVADPGRCDGARCFAEGPSDGTRMIVYRPGAQMALETPRHLPSQITAGPSPVGHIVLRRVGASRANLHGGPLPPPAAPRRIVAARPPSGRPWTHRHSEDAGLVSGEGELRRSPREVVPRAARAGPRPARNPARRGRRGSRVKGGAQRHRASDAARRPLTREERPRTLCGTAGLQLRTCP